MSGIDSLKVLLGELEDVRRREIADRVIIGLMLQSIGLMSPATRAEIEKQALGVADKLAGKDPRLAEEIKNMLAVIPNPQR